MSFTDEAKMGAALPKTKSANGLHAIARELVDEPERVRYAVVRLDTGHIDHDFVIDEDGERYEVLVPKARIRAIEPLTGDAAREAGRLMDAARAERMGELPYHAITSRRGGDGDGDSISGD